MATEMDMHAHHLCGRGTGASWSRTEKGVTLLVWCRGRGSGRCGLHAEP